jgi:tRNA(Ile)-lysidine synthase
MALASGVAFVAERLGLRHCAVIVDHQLQPGSADVAGAVSQRLVPLGFDPVLVRTVSVGDRGGPEAAAREARYAALHQAADEMAAAVILLGHTLDDQAESMLLGLARGSGARSLGGMAPINGRLRRPLLAVTRATTRRACEAQSLQVWDDPHNLDLSYRRVRVREHVMPVLEEHLGPGVSEALARTADLLRQDDSALERWADDTSLKASVTTENGIELEIDVLDNVPEAVRRRVIRSAALHVGVPGGDLRASHLAEIDRLLSSWKGQGAVHLPGGVRAWRSCGRLLIARPHDEPGPSL